MYVQNDQRVMGIILRYVCRGTHRAPPPPQPHGRPPQNLPGRVRRQTQEPIPGGMSTWAPKGPLPLNPNFSPASLNPPPPRVCSAFNCSSADWTYLRNGMQCEAADTACQYQSYVLMSPSCAVCVDAYSHTADSMLANCFPGMVHGCEPGPVLWACRWACPGGSKQEVGGWECGSWGRST